MPHERSEAAGQVHLDVQVIRRETDKAFQVVLDDGRIWWLPRSQIVDADEYEAGDRDCTLTIPEWLFNEKERTDDQ